MTVLTKAPESQFAYVVLAATARAADHGRRSANGRKPENLKATRIACEELDHGYIEYDFTEPDSIDTDKDGNKRRK